MKPAEIIGKHYLRNFLFFLLLILFIGTVISACVLYFNIHRPLNTHYSAILTIITQLKESLIIKTIKINILFMLLIIFGMGILTLIYTHRIAGPLYRIKTIAKSISKGTLNTKIKLRRRDAVNALAESLNKMTLNLNNRITSLSDSISELKSSIEQLQHESEGPDKTDDILKEVISADQKIIDHFNDIKFHQKKHEV